MPDNSDSPPPWEFDTEFQGADLGCGVLLLDLQFHCKPLKPGTVVRVFTQDLGAPNELPAWCRMTKNTLLEAKHPYYLIRKGGSA